MKKKKDTPLDAALAEKDAIIAQHVATLADRDTFIQALYQQMAAQMSAVTMWIKARQPPPQ